MARQLWLLRHGEAEPHDACAHDADRRLTERGEAQSRAAGRALARLELPIHLALASPKVRARDTAALACAEIGVAVHEHRPLADGFDGDEALAIIAATGGDQRVLVVGHNPDFAQVVHDLTGSRIELRKGAIAGVRVHRGRPPELIALLQPRELSRLGDPR